MFVYLVICSWLSRSQADRVPRACEKEKVALMKRRKVTDAIHKNPQTPLGATLAMFHYLQERETTSSKK